MKKKKIIISIIIVLLIVLIGGIIYFKLNYYKTETAMQELTENLDNYNNLHVHTIQTSSLYGTCEYDRYWKDYEYKENTDSYINSNEKIFMTINITDDGEKEVWIYENDESDTDIVTEKALQLSGFLMGSNESNWKQYTYCGTETINNKECYKIYIKSNLQESEQTLWIEKETGFVLKLESIFDGETITYEHTYEVGTVTDEDVSKLDLQAYQNNGYEIVYKEK